MSRFRTAFLCVLLAVAILVVAVLVYGSDTILSSHNGHHHVNFDFFVHPHAAQEGSSLEGDAVKATSEAAPHHEVADIAPSSARVAEPDDPSRQYILRSGVPPSEPAERFIRPIAAEMPANRTYHCRLLPGEDCCRVRDPSRPMVWDTFTFNGDWEMFALRLGMLSPWVDMFVLVQSNLTFGGQPKPYVTPEDPMLQNWRRCLRITTVLSNGTDGPVSIETVETIDGSKRADDNSPWPRPRFRDEVEYWFRDNTVYGYKQVGEHRGVAPTDWVLFSDLDEIYDPQLVMWLIERHGDKFKWFFLIFKEYQYGYWNERPNHGAPGSTLINGDDAMKYRMSAIYYHGRRGGSSDRCKTRKTKRLIKRLLLGNREGMDTACPFSALGFHPKGVQDSGWHCSNCFPSVERILQKLCAFGWMLDLLSTRGYTPQTFFDVIKTGRIVHSTSSKQLKARYRKTNGWDTSPDFASLHRDKFKFLMSPEELTLGEFTGCPNSRVKMHGVGNTSSPVSQAGG
eukprot:TRINITY_DN1994_c1_g1_i7.p1 TRINITY_DN1994_c1_g1~~TRINITY_DN1994_c1_g1_i7.p1  ORF type:complete len:511 (+),score=136.43 TRINITY_DN1994_c1_g1_i7:328-1860(+)